MLETGLVEAVVCVQSDSSDRFAPRPVVARCAADILAARGVKPTLSPNLNVLATVEALDVKRLLFIGVGCQVRGGAPPPLPGAPADAVQQPWRSPSRSCLRWSVLACPAAASGGLRCAAGRCEALCCAVPPLQVQALRSIEKYLGLEKLYVLGTNCVDNGPRQGLGKFLNAASATPDTVLHYEFMQVVGGPAVQGWGVRTSQ
jgi:coenzyme F420-reducing hydrogenase beta subunit